MDQTGEAYCALAFAVRSETRGGAPDATCIEEGATDSVGFQCSEAVPLQAGVECWRVRHAACPPAITLPRLLLTTLLLATCVLQITNEAKYSLFACA